MKKVLITGAALMLYGVALAQTPVGLDSIYVEKYYVSDQNDKSVDGTGGTLPLHSATYRVYVCMKPGYKFEAIYGVDVQPTGTRNAGDHELRFETTTQFFNNEDRGDVTPSYSKSNAKNNTVMLDSWFSVGAGCAGTFGVPKTEDNGTMNVVNADGVLQNNDAWAGIPLTTQDGLLTTTATPEPVTQVGVSSDVAIFNDMTNGSLFSTYNGSIASLNGSYGPTSTNRILVAQMTTNGTFSFKMNVQLGTPTAGGVENWVADSPVSGEGTHPTLTYTNTYQPTTVISHKTQSDFFSVYPNPASDAVVIDITKSSSSANTAYTIYGIDGKAIATKQLGTISSRHQEKIDISSLAPGLYFIEVSSNGERSTKRIVKY